MFCPACGNEGPDNSAFCFKCGRALHDVTAKPEPVFTEPKDSTELKEVEFLNHLQILVTSKRIVVGTTTYSVSNVSSVSMTEQENSTGAIVIIGLLAVLLPCGAGFQLLSAGIDPFLTMIVTFVIFVGGLFGAIKLQPKDKIYTLRISSNSGEQRLLQTGDKVFANHVTKAVQSAISR